jgi:hypothetical protein
MLPAVHRLDISIINELRAAVSATRAATASIRFSLVEETDQERLMVATRPARHSPVHAGAQSRRQSDSGMIQCAGYCLLWSNFAIAFRRPGVISCPVDL